jgi:hypothetical protein
MNHNSICLATCSVETTINLSRDSRNLKPGLREHEAGLVTTRLRRFVSLKKIMN